MAEIAYNCSEGICPVCGAEVHYTDGFELEDNGGFYPWYCSACKTTGKEGYNLVFDGSHYELKDENGNDIIIPNNISNSEEPPLRTYRVGFSGDETEVDACSEREALHLALDIALESNSPFCLEYVEPVEKVQVPVISLSAIAKGYASGVITLIDSPNGDGVVCQIGSIWFYFGGHTAEAADSVEEFVRNVPKEDIIKEIYETLDAFRTDGCPEYTDEYAYYQCVLTEKGIM